MAALSLAAWGREVMLKGDGTRMIVVDVHRGGALVVCAWLDHHGVAREAPFKAAALDRWRPYRPRA